MRTEITKRKLYTFDELSERAQERALEQESRVQSEMWEPEFVYEDFERVCDILGVELSRHPVKLYGGGTRQDPDIEYSGFWSQGDGARFRGTYRYKKGSCKAIREYAPQDKELHRIADRLQAMQKPFFYGLVADIEYGRYGGSDVHSGTMEVETTHALDNSYQVTCWDNRVFPWSEMEELMRALANWLYKQLEEEYTYQTGAEACKEAILANEREFDEEGNFA